MANKILIKRSTTDGSIPGAGALDLGELAINTFNGRLFAKKDNGSASVIDLTRNDPIRVLGDASSTYEWDQGTYTSNITVTLNNSGVSSGSYGSKTAGTIQNGGNILIPTFGVHANGIVYTAGTVSLSASDFGTMAVQDANAVNISGGVATLANVTVTDNFVLGPGSEISGDFALTGDQTITGNLTVTQDVTVSGNLFSNDISATTVTVDGDAVITGNLTVQGTQTIVDSTTVSIGDKNIVLAKDAADSAQADGAGLTINGAAATLLYNHTGTQWEMNKPLQVSGLIKANGGIAVDTDRFTVADATGDVYTKGKLEVDGATDLNGLLDVSSTFNANGAATLQSTLQVEGTLTANGMLNVYGGLRVTGTYNTPNHTPYIDIDDGTADIKISDGNIRLGDGFSGAGTSSWTQKAIFYGETGDISTEGNLTVNGMSTLAQAKVSDLTTNGLVIVGAAGRLTTSPNVTWAGGTLTVDGNLTVTGDQTFSGGLTMSGLFNADGGIAVDTNKFTVQDGSGNVYIDGTLTVNNAGDFNSTLNVDGHTDLNSTLTVDGATTINNTLLVANAVTLSDDLAVNGGDLTTSQTTFNLVNTTATTVNFAGAATTVEIGAATGTTNVNNDLDVDGNVNIDGNQLTTSQTTFNLLNTTATTVNFAGAATTVEIGAASGTTNINNSLDVDGDVNIDGGDLTVSTTTFNLANTTATTVNFAGAATTLEIGAATGTTNINNNLDVDGNVNIDGDQLTTSQTTFNLLNTTATTVNFAGAATTLEIGAATGTTTVNNNLTVDGNVAVTGDFALNTDKFTIDATTGDFYSAGSGNIAGNLVLNNITINGTANLTGGVSSNDVAAFQIVFGNNSTGALDGQANLTYNSTTNTVTANNLVLTEKLDVAGNVAVNTNKFNITASSGDTAIAGTLGVQGSTTLSNTLDVTGAATFANTVSLTANISYSAGNYTTGTMRITGDQSIAGKLQVSGAIYKAGFEVINTEDTIDGGTY